MLPPPLRLTVQHTRNAPNVGVYVCAPQPPPLPRRPSRENIHTSVRPHNTNNTHTLPRSSIISPPQPLSPDGRGSLDEMPFPRGGKGKKKRTRAKRKGGKMGEDDEDVTNVPNSPQRQRDRGQQQWRQEYTDLCQEWENIKEESGEIQWQFHLRYKAWQHRCMAETLAIDGGMQALEKCATEQFCLPPPQWPRSMPLSFTMVWATGLIEKTLDRLTSPSSSLRGCHIIHSRASKVLHLHCAAHIANKNKNSNTEPPIAFLVSLIGMEAGEYQRCAMTFNLPTRTDKNAKDPGVCILFVQDWYVNLVSLTRLYRRKSQRLLEGILSDQLKCALCFGPDEGGLTPDAAEPENRLAQCPICNTEHCQACLEGALHSRCIQCKEPLELEVVDGILGAAPLLPGA